MFIAVLFLIAKTQKQPRHPSPSVWIMETWYICVHKGTTEDEMAGWHHWLDGRESQWTPGVGDGQGGLACCDSWGRKESDTTEWLIWYIYIYIYIYIYSGILFVHKMKKILPFVPIWTNLEDIMLSEICQAEKDKYCVISLKYEILKTNNLLLPWKTHLAYRRSNQTFGYQRCVENYGIR